MESSKSFGHKSFRYLNSNFVFLFINSLEPNKQRTTPTEHKCRSKHHNTNKYANS